MVDGSSLLLLHLNIFDITLLVVILQLKLYKNK